MEKWISTKLDVRGNAIKARRMMELKLSFDPNDIVKTHLVLMKLGLNPMEDEGMRRMKKQKAQAIAKKEAAQSIPKAIAQGMQNGLILFPDCMKAWRDKVKPDVRPTTYTGYHCNIYNVIGPYFQKRRIHLQDIAPTTSRPSTRTRCRRRTRTP